MKIAVAGGTGLVGAKVVALARVAGHDVVVLSRSNGVDLVSGSGLSGILAGCDAVVDVSNVATMRKKKAVRFFSEAGRHLVAEAKRAGVQHVIALSIVGCDTVDYGYYFGKRAQEDALRHSEVPWTILRATQFFEFPELLFALRTPVVIAPKILSQPVAADDVARTILDLLASTPSEATVELAGPEQLQMVDMTRRIASARKLHRVVLPISLPGGVGRAMSSGALLPSQNYIEGTSTFDDYVASIGASTA